MFRFRPKFIRPSSLEITTAFSRYCPLWIV